MSNILDSENVLDLSAEMQVDFLKGEKGDKGDKGDSNTITIGSVTKGEYAEASIEGESPNQILNLVLPKGDKGEQGEQGMQGEKGEQGEQGLRGERGEQGEKGEKPIKGTDYWTADEVLEMKQEILAQVNQFKVLVVDELPSEDVDEHTIYFLPKDASEHDVYEEFIYINGDWEHIGTTEVDLSNYYNKEEVDTIATECKEISISPTEPTSEEVMWVKKGKNLAKPTYGQYYKENNRQIVADQNWLRTDYIEVKVGETYIFSHQAGTRNGRIATFDSGLNYIGIINNENITQPFTITGNVKYVIVGAYVQNASPTTDSWIQLERGNVATSHEAYIEPEILVKQNGVFEEFKKKNIKIGDVINPDESKFQITYSRIIQVDNTVYIDIYIKLLATININQASNFKLKGVDKPISPIWSMAEYASSQWRHDYSIYNYIENDNCYIYNSINQSVENGFWRLHTFYNVDI